MENKVIAIVNGKEITQKDLELTISRFPQDRQGYFLTEQGRKQVLDQMISFELIHDYAIESQLDKDEEYLEQIEAMKKEILTQVAIRKVMNKAVVSDKEIEDYYNANQNMFKQEETVSAKHILVNTLEKAEEVANEIKKGMAFEEAASKYSECPSKANGGSLGSFGKGRMVPEFENAAFNLQVGALSEPVKTQFGYHLIIVDEKSSSTIRPLKEVKEMISSQLLQERQSYQYMKFTEDLKNKYKVEII